jgi:peptidoglycan/LPS O-acetylase OafA/YrhL
MSDTGYRPDIDGLRAVAIIPVVAYHYGLGMPGGFVGVDVFFVISGFLITGILLQDFERKRYSIARFYERRVRRIFPALFFLLAVTTIAAIVRLVPTELEDYGKSLLSTVTFLSNIFFMRGTAYFAQVAETKLLLHTWSLAVEEQFYVFFPLVLWVFMRYWQRLLPYVILTGLAISFWLAELAVEAWPRAAFYLLPTRGWELMCGALFSLRWISPTRSDIIRVGASVGGGVLLVTSVFCIDSTMPFPGLLALPPCLGAMLVIYAGQCGGGPFNRLLAMRLPVFIGLVSYSLYLWHWPIIVLARDAWANIPILGRLTLAAVAMVFAWFSWQVVERPFRNKNGIVPVRTLWSAAAAAGAILLVFGEGLVWQKGLPWRFPQEIVNIQVFKIPAHKDCFDRPPEAIAAGPLCRIGAPHVAATFMVWGDSHAFRLGLMLDDFAMRRGLSGYLVTGASCPPLLGVRTLVSACQRFNDAVIDQIEKRDVRTVFLDAVWAYYAEGRLSDELEGGMKLNWLEDEQSSEHSVAENRRVLRRSLMRTIRRLEHDGRQVIMVGPVPDVPYSVPEALMRALIRQRSLPQGPTLAEFYARERYVFASLKEVAQLTHAQILYPHHYLCASRCSVTDGTTPLYMDNNHLSNAGLERILPILNSIWWGTGSAPRAKIGRELP